MNLHRKQKHYHAYRYTEQQPAVPRRRWSNRTRLAFAATILFLMVGGVAYAMPSSRPAASARHVAVVKSTPKTVVAPAKPAPAPAPTPTPPAPAAVAAAPMPAPKPVPTPAPAPLAPCSGNTVANLILVSISQQYMWACSGAQQVYESAVTTGAYEVAGDATPTGTWQIYGKQTNLYLVGPGYKDFVQYWMPFYSDYGFHDASWQTFPFGSSQYATDGSHGCVHLPTTTAAWVYNWAPIGTTVTIQA